VCGFWQTERRLAQNREAARKSRLRKKVIGDWLITGTPAMNCHFDLFRKRLSFCLMMDKLFAWS